MGDAMRAGRFAVTWVAAALLASGLGGCGDKPIQPEVLQTWVGRPAATLEKDWGTATREVQDGDLRILIYEEVQKGKPLAFGESTSTSRFFGATGAAHVTATEVYRTPTVYVRSYLFWVNREGTIVNSAVRQP
jgi:hypothetical protein